MSECRKSPLAGRLVSEVVFTAFDLETTGLYHTTDRIVEFGAVRFRSSAVLATFSQLANPGVPVGSVSTVVSGITDADVRDAPPVEAVVKQFVQFLGTAILVAHNAPFDLAFLRAAARQAGLPDIANSVVDTQVLATRAFPRQKSYGLQNLAAELGLPRGTAHRALDDSLLCMRLFISCVEALGFMGELELSQVLAPVP